MAKFGDNMKDAGKKLDDFNKGQRDAAKEAMKNAATATKDAATAIVRLPGTRAIEVHQACPKAPNGAPDCQEAAVNACRRVLQIRWPACFSRSSPSAPSSTPILIPGDSTSARALVSRISLLIA